MPDRYRQMGEWVRALTPVQDSRVEAVVEEIRDALGERCPCCNGLPLVGEVSSGEDLREAVHSLDRLRRSLEPTPDAHAIGKVLRALGKARSDVAGLRDPAQMVKASHDVRRAMYENGATEDVLKGWSAFAGWITAGCPNEADLRGPAEPVGMYPPAIDETDMERSRRIAARAEDLPGSETVTVDLIESLYEEVMRLRPNAAAMRVTGDALASAAEWVAVAGESRDWRALNAKVADWRSVTDPGRST